MDCEGLSICNAEPQQLAGPQLLHHLIPDSNDATAIEYLIGNKRTSYSYRYLQDASQRLAQLIGSLYGGIGLDQDADVVVPILMPQCPHLYISLLAVLKFGGAFCPMNLDSPPERLRFILKDVAAKIVLVTRQVANQIPSDCAAQIVIVDDDRPESQLVNEHDENGPTPTPESLAYVMYTSGSTGTPKGVGISHKAATQALLAHDRYIPKFSRFLQFAAPTFDVFVFETFFPLFRGVILISAKREELLNDLPAVMRRMDVDACELTPTVAGSLLKVRKGVPKLRLLMTIGEMLKMPVIHEFGGSDDCESLLWAMYGPTEASIHCTLQASLPSTSSPGNIGRPLDTVSCFVIQPAKSLSENQEIVILPKGEAGELAVGGYQLARGYINRPEQTSSAFINSPYGRVYRTGDRVVMNQDGTLECLGRISDGQIKLRGQRIELGEVEHAALRTAGCHGAHATVVASSLILFCAVDPAIYKLAVEESCKSWLPKYMVPTEIVLMHEFPRLPSGKVDSKTLKETFIQSREKENSESTAHVQTLNPRAAKILRIVSETLNVEVNGKSALTAVGLDSLSAIRLVGALRQNGLVTSVTKLLNSRLLEDMYVQVEEGPLHDRASEYVETDQRRLDTVLAPVHEEFGNIHHQRPIEYAMFCTPLQSAMLAETARNPALYCNEILLRTTHDIPVQTLVDSFHKVIQMNEALRTGFVYRLGKHISIVFSAPSDSQVAVLTQPNRGFKMDGADSFLHPFMVQLIPDTENGTVDILIQAHHAVYDGWSMDMLLSDVSRLVMQKSLPQRHQFSKVVCFLTGDVNTSKVESRVFWSEILLSWNRTTFPKLLARPGPDEIKTHCAILDLCPSSVREMSKDCEVGSQVLFQAALVMAWQGVTGHSDVLIGSVLSGRTIPVDGIEGIIGPCIASLPLRVDLDKMSAHMDVLKNIHTSNRLMMEHCDLPLPEIGKVAGLRPGEPLYDVLFVYQQSLGAVQGKDEILRHIEHIDRLETKLLVEVEPSTTGFSLQITYHSAFVSESFVSHFSQQIRHLSSRILSAPTATLASTGNLQGCEMSVYAAKSDSYQGPDDVVALFEESAGRNPDAEALRIMSTVESSHIRVQTMTYAALSRAADKTAHFVHEKGAEVGDIVVIIMDKSAALYTTILGTLKAGCAYLPILPTTPVCRVREILRQSQARYCLVDAAVDNFQNLQDMVTILNVNDASPSASRAEKLAIPSNADRLAYVIFTSGTTGVPKGVAVTHRNLASNIMSLSTVYPKSSVRPRLLQACSHTFDVSVFEIFYAWSVGMSLCAADNDTLFRDIEYAIRELGITHLSLTPTVASLINPNNVPSVEFLVAAGEPLTPSVLQNWHGRLFQGYGPSEATNICTFKRMSLGDHVEHLGWVLPNTSAVVMNPITQDVVPLGWVGELCLGGSQVSRGYLNDAASTARKFIEQPSFGRIYRSGDVGRMLPDGSLMVFGRLDDQLKLRGQRIEASEVNGTVTNITPVDAAVTILTHSIWNRSDQLTTFYTSSGLAGADRATPTTQDLHHRLMTALKARLPSYMVPTYLIPISQIPRAPSGKVDRHALQRYFSGLQKDYLETVCQEPSRLEECGEWTYNENVIAEAITESYNIRRSDIERWTPFPALGIDSITAIGFSKLVSSRFGRQVPISAILRNSSVALLGQALNSENAATVNDTAEKMQRLTRSLSTEVEEKFKKHGLDTESIWPCVPLQEAMLLQSQRSYYNRTLLRLHISPDEMKSYWTEASRRHCILRTCFVTTRNLSYPIAQVVLRKWTLPWKTFKVTVPSLEDVSREHLESLPEPLDSLTPPSSLAIIRYKGLNFLSFICHHALYDGIAMANLWREIESMAHGRDLPIPTPYAPFLQEALNLPPDVDSFWKDQFRGFNGSPTLARSSRHSLNQYTHPVSIDISFEDLQKKSRSFGVSLLSSCQAAWAAVLSSVFEKSDIAFGNVVSGRTIAVEGIDKLVAPCFNTIPLRMDISRTAQNMDLLKAFQNLNSRLLPYQFSPLKLVQKIAGMRRQSLFDTLFILQQPLQDMDESVWTLEEDVGDMDVPIVCEVIPCPNLNSVLMHLHYDVDTITNDLASVISDMFKLNLRAMVLNPYDAVATRYSLPASYAERLRTLVIRRDRKEDLNSTSLIETGAEWTELEEKIRQTIASISGTSKHVIKRQTTIFQLGLDSINAVQIASMLRAQNLSVSSSDVVECANCERLAARIIQNGRSLSRDCLSFDFTNYHQAAISHMPNKVLSGADIEAILPCTSLQDAMLSAFFNSVEGYYLNFLTYKIRNDVNLSSLEHAWIRLQQSHPMLRSGFVSTPQPESSFSMVRWKKNSCKAPLIIFQDQSCADFDVSNWRKESRLVMRKNPGELLWRVALVETASTRTMNIAIHHALYDAKSLGGLLHGLARILNGDDFRFSSIEPALAQLLLRTRSKDSETQNFWENLADKVVANRFPVMNPLREENWRTVTCQNKLSISIVEMRAATKIIGVSIQALLQAAWARLLSSYLGETSVVFGVVLAGRNTDETADAPLPCLTTVPVIAETTSSNKEILENMMDYNSRLHKHQFSSLASIQKWLGHAGSPVFDTVLVYQNTPSCSSNTYWDLVTDEPSVEYTVSLEVEPIENEELHIRLTTRNDVVPIEQAELILRQFNATLVHLVRAPNGKGDELYKTAPELFSITPAKFPSLQAPVSLVHEFVEQKADSQPNFPALEFVESFSGEPGSTRTWTYRQLDEIGNQVAHLLSETIVSGDIVAVHFPKCPEAYFCLLGILKAGCSFVALDPSAPNARIQFILQDSKATCLLTNGSLDIECDLDIAVVSISEDKLAPYSISRLVHVKPLSPENTCYCLYTSGTTGAPKGCEISHENTVQALMAFQDLFQGYWQQDSRWLQFAGFHFDVSVLEQYWSWSVGITVVAAPKELILDDLVGSINKLAITHIDLTPSLARLTHPDEVPSLCKGVFITGGEQLNQEILDVWGPKGVIYNAYGPTEATIGVTMYQRVPVNGRPSNIGKQFLNVGTYVFHSGTTIPVLRGGVGELCVSGKLVGKGYLHRPDLTNEKFPTLSEFSRERIYRTGDLVRILSDGCFDFLGRADDQVKLRGQRLEIGEVNHVICSKTRGIRSAATLVVNHNGKDVLVAFIAEVSERAEMSLRIADCGGDLASKARASCLESLPGYMIPTYFIVLTHLPLSSNNKVETKQLKSLFMDLDQQILMKYTGRSGSVFNKPVDGYVFNRVIEVLAAFSSISKDQISEATSVFDLGVDSVSALQLSTVLKENGINGVTAALIIRNPIISDLVRSVTNDKQMTNSTAKSNAREIHQRLQAWKHKYQRPICQVLSVEPDDIDYIAPCSPLQEGMISAALSEEVSRPYFNWFDIQLSRDTSMTAMRQAWEKTIQNLPILRTVFVETTDGYFQVAMKQAKNYWRSKSVTHRNETKVLFDLEFSQWVADNASNVQSPLRFIHVTGPDWQELRLCIFHGLYDGSSIRLMQDHAACIYQAKAPNCGPSYIHALCCGSLQNLGFCRPFWEEHLRNWRASPLPRTTPLQENCGQVISLSREFPGGMLEALRKGENVTLQAIVLAAWTAVLQSYVAEPLTLGVVVSGRAVDLPQIENTIGPLFNTMPFFSGSLVDMTWRRLVQRCHQFNVDTLAFQHVPLTDIQKWCSKGRSLFDSLFSFQQEESTSAINSRPWTFIDGGSSSVNYPLACEATQIADGNLQLHLVSRDGVVDRGTLERMLDHFVQITSTVKPDTMLAKDSLQESTDKKNSRPLSMELISSAQPDWTPTALVLREELCVLANIPFEVVKPNTSILELGIDSIDAIKISARLSKRGIRLTASHITRLQTISSIASAAVAVTLDNACVASVDSFLSETQTRLHHYLKKNHVDLDAVELVLPPTALQESMVAGMFQSDFEWYFNHDVLELDDSVDILKLKDAWSKVIASSPILRTGFLEIDDNQIKAAYCQVVYKESRSSIEMGQISDTTRLQEIILKARKRALHGRGLQDLLQVALVSGPSNSNYMVISMAHALYDGWSLALLYDDLKAAYQGKLQSREYLRILTTQSVLCMSSDSDGFWKTYLANTRPTVLIQEKTLSTNQNPSVVYRKECVDPQSTSTITSFCRRNTLSLQSICTACWAVVLGFLAKSLDPVFGVVLSGRDFDGADKLMFPTMNTVAVRSILHGTGTSFLTYVESCLADIRAHQGVPLREAQAAAKLGGKQLFNSLFILQKSRDNAASEFMWKSIHGLSAVEYPICVEAEVLGETLTWRIACKEEFFSENDAEDILRKMSKTLQFFLASSDADILSFDDRSVSICGLPRIIPLDSSSAVADHDIDIVPQNSDEQTTFAWDDISTRIRAVLSEVSAVPVETILPTTTLYHLGLDSISAIKVSLMLRKADIDLKPRELLQASSIAEMASSVERGGSSHAPTFAGLEDWELPMSVAPLEKLLSQLNISSNNVEETLPATALQIYMLSAWQNSSGSVFFPQFGYEVSREYTQHQLRYAWNVLVEFVPMLRTYLVSTGAREMPWVQIILKSNSPSVVGACHPFSCLQIDEGPSQQSWLLRLTIQHALYDGFSLPAIMRLYDDLLRQTATSNEPKVDIDLLHWKQFSILPTLKLQTQSRKEFWIDYLQSEQAFPLIQEDTRLVSTPQTVDRVSYLRQQALYDTKDLQQRASALGIGLQSLFFAALAQSLYHHQRPQETCSPTVIFGVYLANRTWQSQHLHATFPTLNLVPLRVALPEGSDLGAIAMAIHKDLQLLQRDTRAQVGLWEIYDWTGIQVDVFVNFLSLLDDKIGADSETVQDVLCRRADQDQPVDSPRSREVLDQPWLQNNVVKNAYPVGSPVFPPPLNPPSSHSATHHFQ
ncbi:NRPS protein [Claviceps pusilla]|uniref:Nonribosomal peptide synthetase sidN n=1 Tax=Claviceps pusilla TaxID=123648 RepID=A0A9P7NEJ2_9HYPO|nr:NRPS protein [Claviceps pusilla]